MKESKRVAIIGVVIVCIVAGIGFSVMFPNIGNIEYTTVSNKRKLVESSEAQNEILKSRTHTERADANQRLRELKSLLDDDLISEEEYHKRRNEIISGL